MAERIIVTITSELFDDPMQEASIRANLTAHDLIQETLQEFNLPDGNYGLVLENSGQALQNHLSLRDQGVQTGASLIFRRELGHTVAIAIARSSGTHKQVITQTFQPALKEFQTGKVFRIAWQPALIGRPDSQNPVSDRELAVNVEGLPNASSVSRKHARITTDETGKYFLEGLNEHNPTFVDEQALTPGEKHALQTGNIIRVGNVRFRFEMGS